MLTAIKQLPPGLNTAYRYNRQYPANPGNLEFAEAYNKLAGYDPTNWAWQAFVACGFIVESLKRTGGKTDGMALAGEMAGMQLPSPLAVDGTLTMRKADHTLIGYPVAWGRTVPKPPFVEDFVPVEWSKILELEAQWKAEKGYA